MVGFTWYWIPFDGMFIVELFWVSTYPSEAFQLVCGCLPYSPFQWPCHPNLGLWFLTSLMSFFSEYEYHNMFRRSRITLPRIFKSLSFPFEQVLEVVTFQLPHNCHPFFSYLKINGFTWDHRYSLLGFLMSLCFKYHRNPMRQSKVIGPQVQGTEIGY